MELSQLAEGLVRIERHNNEYLGITTYIPTNTFAVTKLTTQQRDNGFIVRDNEVEIWKPSGFTEFAGRLFLYGPFVHGKTLSEIIRGDADQVLPYLSRLARAMRVLQQQEGVTPYVHTRGIIFVEDGGVLFMPRDLMKSIRDFQSTTDRIEFRELYRHPDVPTEQEPSFALAVTAYRCLTERFPYSAETEEDLRERMRTGHVERPMYIRPEIREEISDALHGALRDPQSRLPSLEEWEAHFTEWLTTGPYRALSEEGRLEVQAKAEAERASLNRAFRRQEYFRRNWKRLVAITLVAILVGTIPATVIYNNLQPSPTAGLPPDEVVRAFYTSITALDHQTMEGATVEGAGSGLIDEVTGVYVFARMRLAVELREAFLDPQPWREQGMPRLEDGRSVYGIANFMIEAQRSPDPEEEVFRVRYEKWSPQQPTSEERADAAVRVPEGQLITERVFLRRERGDWVIYRIDRERQEELPGPDW